MPSVKCRIKEKNITKNTVIIISGFGVTGKSTFEKLISEKFNIPIVCNDQIKEIV